MPENGSVPLPVNPQPSFSPESVTAEAAQPASAAKAVRPVSSRLPSLDGWRAISILIVLFSHAPLSPDFPSAWSPFFKFVFDGNFGVRIFFVISGLLITWLLLIEANKKGRMDLSHFYARRALRIVPVYGAFLLVLAICQWSGVYWQSRTAWWSNVTFTTNYFTSEAKASGHLWSLGVEEQFYLLWPGLMALFALPRKKKLAFVFLAIPIVLAPVCRSLPLFRFNPGRWEWLFSFGSILNYCDSLAIGCAAAFLLYHYREQVEASLTANRLEWVVMAILFILIPYLLFQCGLAGRLTLPFGHSSEAIGIAILLLQGIVSPNWGLYKVLNLRIMVQLGILSYSIYIWHVVTWETGMFNHFGHRLFASYPGWIPSCILIALVSFYCLEQPLMKWRARLR